MLVGPADTPVVGRGLPTSPLNAAGFNLRHSALVADFEIYPPTPVVKSTATSTTKANHGWLGSRLPQGAFLLGA